MMIEYKFVAVHGSMLFEDRMKELVEKGWMPLGGPAVKVVPNQPNGTYDDRPTFYQHMVRHADD